MNKSQRIRELEEREGKSLEELLKQGYKEEQLSGTQLSKKLGLSKSVIYYLLSVLELCSFLQNRKKQVVNLPCKAYAFP